MTRPLLICDCDEVLLHFTSPFRGFLSDVHDLELRFDSFALHGNVRHRTSGDPVENQRLPELLDQFFRNHMPTQTLVPGVAAALKQVAEAADIVVLTNLTDDLRDMRTAQLAGLGLPLTVYTNQGPKGPAVVRLLDQRKPARAMFIDDLPPHHSSVKAHAPHVHRLHMVAEPELHGVVPAADDADARIDHWHDAVPWILERLR